MSAHPAILGLRHALETKRFAWLSTRVRGSMPVIFEVTPSAHERFTCSDAERVTAGADLDAVLNAARGVIQSLPPELRPRVRAFSRIRPKMVAEGT